MVHTNTLRTVHGNPGQPSLSTNLEVHSPYLLCTRGWWLKYSCNFQVCYKYRRWEYLFENPPYGPGRLGPWAVFIHLLQWSTEIKPSFMPPLWLNFEVCSVKILAKVLLQTTPNYRNSQKFRLMKYKCCTVLISYLYICAKYCHSEDFLL